MKIKEVIQATKGNLIIGNLDNEFGRISTDTRYVKPGETFLGIKGENFNGNEMWQEALNNGASTVIVENITFESTDLEKNQGKNIILVDDTIEALGEIAKYKREQYGKDFILVGVTGSVGKTSTKDMIANVISRKYKTLKTQGNLNSRIGMPCTILNLNDHEAAVIEMGMNNLGQITKLSKTAEPKIAVITNVGTAHIGILGSRENILKAKLEILDGMDKKVLVINNDNDLLHDFYLNNNNKDIEIHTYGLENKSEAMAENIELGENSSDFICNINGNRFKVHVPVGGIHFVYNALCAATVGNLVGLTTEEIVNGIDSFELTAKRMDITELENGVTIINDSYNASCESMQAAIRYLSRLKSSRKIAVLGDMFELGEYSQELHEKVGKEVAKNNIDMLLCLGENAKYIVEAAKLEGMDEGKIHYFKTKDEIENFIRQNWNEGDSILFKASNGMKFFEIVEKLI